jgi:hypothetical protein
VAAIAAVVVAVLTAVNLWVTGRREQRTWVRTALEGAFVDVLTASYQGMRAGTSWNPTNKARQRQAPTNNGMPRRPRPAG